MQTDRQTDRQTNGRANGSRIRQTDRQTDIARTAGVLELNQTTTTSPAYESTKCVLAWEERIKSVLEKTDQSQS